MSRKHDFEINFFESVLRRNPKYTEVIEILGELYTRTGRIEEGLRMDRRLVRLLPDNPNAHYNLACSLALKNRRSEAINTLEKAVSLGYDDVDWLMQDPDLEALKNLPDFQKLISAINPNN
jgi:tetratricopeptide (TPR) repeat protein